MIMHEMRRFTQCRLQLAVSQTEEVRSLLDGFAKQFIDRIAINTRTRLLSSVFQEHRQPKLSLAPGDFEAIAADKTSRSIEYGCLSEAEAESCP
jgi:hypothetical protein